MPREPDANRLSADDAHILGAESAVITGHTLKLIILDGGAAPLDIDALRKAVAKRLPTQPRASQRVDTSGPQPRWVEAVDFDISDHVRRRTAPGCASEADLWKSVSALTAEHLDRTRPLWTFDVVGPLADGREAIAVRIHHAMCDGIAAIRFLHAVLWDPHPEPPAGERAGPARADRARTDQRGTADAGSGAARTRPPRVVLALRPSDHRFA
jgi:NRPS condensation-like uncharacterized protein